MKILVSELSRDTFREIYDINEKEIPWYVRSFRVSASRGGYTVMAFTEININVFGKVLFKKKVFNNCFKVGHLFFMDKVRAISGIQIHEASIYWDYINADGWNVTYNEK